MSRAGARASCNGCIHLRRMAFAGMACHYILDTGNPRGCPAERCGRKMTRRQYNALSASERKKVLADGDDI